MKPFVFIPERIATCGVDLLREHCEIVAPWLNDSPVDSKRLHDAQAVIVRLYAVGADEISAAPQLKVIAKHGVGVDNIDVPAATRRGIPVVFTPTANANAVAEHAVAMMFALARQIAPAAQAVLQGRFQQRTQFQGIELAGKTLGVIGLGRIGSRVAEIAALGLNMRVLGYDPMLVADAYTGPATLVSSIETVFAEADLLTLHVPLSPQTRHLINAATLAMLKPHCIIVNTSRGGVIDETALVAALHAGRVGGAALDVFEVEPLPADHPLCTAPNVLLTPHISSSTIESLDRMSLDAARGVLDVLHQRRPQYAVNPEVLG